MISCCIMGASGYTGAELVKLLSAHPNFDLRACYVSANSADSNKVIGEVHPSLAHVDSLIMQALSDDQVVEVGKQHDAVFMALPHEVSHHWVKLLSQSSCIIFDLSGAYRLSDVNIFAEHYGFAHEYPNIIDERVYGLAEWYAQDIKQAKQVIAVPGCYPTASLLSLKPLVKHALLDTKATPVINAVSGVSGAGRKATMTTSFFEVSLQAYGVLSHRHTPEIEEFAKSEVIFTPHLGAFKRGILATTTVFLKEGVSLDDVQAAFNEAYAHKPMVRLLGQHPKLDQVVNSPFCDLHFTFDETKRCLVISAAIDNLLKGAASQALQCANIRFNLDETTGLIA